MLANEEVVDGKSEVGGHPVVRLPMRQWMLRITAYADRLLDDLDTLDWPESIKEMQRNWIGRSEGADVEFAVDGHTAPTDKYDPRLHHAPRHALRRHVLVLAPEHPLVDRITTDAQRDAVAAYRDRGRGQERPRAHRAARRRRPASPPAPSRSTRSTGEAVPIWIADYVLAHYGTGAIMAVPAHDERDHEFARAFGLPIVEVVEGGDVDARRAFVGDGPHVGSSTPTAWARTASRSTASTTPTPSAR